MATDVEAARTIGYPDRVLTVQREVGNFKLRAPVRFDEPLAPYTTFRVGGPADVFVVPESVEQLAQALGALHSRGIVPFILGGGANIVVSDAGIRGVVISLTRLDEIRIEGTRLIAEAGAEISAASAAAADAGLAGLDFIYAMPGSVGGAVWMNARCYDGEIAQILAAVEFLNLDGSPGTYTPRASDFRYKISPFQDGRRIMTAASFELSAERAQRRELWRRMREHEEDRRAKGHFDAPSAGSMFKNNRAFGAPSGQIIDRAGLRGMAIGGAQISPGHGNILINSGSATATDIRRLVTAVRREVYRQFGYSLETEVLFVGEWQEVDDAEHD